MESEQRFIVPQLLTESNYNIWSSCMQNYLMAQELWDIVDGTEPKPEPTLPEFKAWRPKNSKALHAIQLSCSPQILSGIIALDSAKDAWDKLFSTHQERSSVPNYWNLRSDQGMMNHTWGLPLYKAVESGDWESAKRIIDAHSEAMTGSLSWSGETALHMAAMNGQLRLVEELVRLMTPEQLEAKNISGDTALGRAAESGVTKMAKVMVRRNPNLVCIENYFRLIPVVVATYNNHKDMAHYLYSVTPKEELSPEKGKWGATLLTATIIADMYDIALDLLQHHPRLATTLDVYGRSAIFELAQRSSAFSSGNQYSFWQQWIYSCIHVQATHTLGNINGVVNRSHQSQVQQQQKINHDWNIKQRPTPNPAQGLELFAQQILQCAYIFEHAYTALVHNILLGPVWDLLKVTGIKQIYDKKLLNTQALELLRCVCHEISTLDGSQILNLGTVQALFTAIKYGIFEFIVEIIKAYPLSLWYRDYDGRGIFHNAILHRQEKIFSLIYGMGAVRSEIAGTWDKFNNNMLHFSGMLSPSTQLHRVSGAAFQMQRELQWFKEIEDIVQPRLKQVINSTGRTPRELFTDEHKKLVKEGGVWMKDTATSCMVVATLIATVMFAAAFTVPGGNHQERGIPLLLKHRSFKVFMIADAFSLFSSTTSVLMFLGILTSRYAEQDFLKSLPKRLIIGLATLFFSIATMMVAFGTALVIVLKDEWKWVATPVILLGSIPVTLFVLLQFPLLVDMIISTYGAGIFNRSTKRWQY